MIELKGWGRGLGVVYCWQNKRADRRSGKARFSSRGVKLTREEKRPGEAGGLEVSQPGFYISTKE